MVTFSITSFPQASMFFDDEAAATTPDASADAAPAAPEAPEAPATESAAE